MRVLCVFLDRPKPVKTGDEALDHCRLFFDLGSLPKLGERIVLRDELLTIPDGESRGGDALDLIRWVSVNAFEVVGFLKGVELPDGWADGSRQLRSIELYVRAIRYQAR